LRAGDYDLDRLGNRSVHGSKHLWECGGGLRRPELRFPFKSSEEQFGVPFCEAPLLFYYRLTDCDNVRMDLHPELPNQARYLWALPDRQQQKLFGSFLISGLKLGFLVCFVTLEGR
jgi:hypothetical protein